MGADRGDEAEDGLVGERHEPVEELYRIVAIDAAKGCVTASLLAGRAQTAEQHVARDAVA